VFLLRQRIRRKPSETVVPGLLLVLKSHELLYLVRLVGSE